MKNIVPMEDKDVAALMNDCYAWYKKWRGKEPDPDSPDRATYLKEINDIVDKYRHFKHLESKTNPDVPFTFRDETIDTAMPLIMWFLNVLERRICDRHPEFQ